MVAAALSLGGGSSGGRCTVVAMLQCWAVVAGAGRRLRLALGGALEQMQWQQQQMQWQQQMEQQQQMQQQPTMKQPELDCSSRGSKSNNSSSSSHSNAAAQGLVVIPLYHLPLSFPFNKVLLQVAARQGDEQAWV